LKLIVVVVQGSRLGHINPCYGNIVIKYGIVKGVGSCGGAIVVQPIQISLHGVYGILRITGDIHGLKKIIIRIDVEIIPKELF